MNFRLGDHEVRPGERRVLNHSGETVLLGARAFDLLLALVEHRDRVVGKDELMALVWPGVVVEENNLTVHISALRKLLGAEAIATVAGRGYRLTRPVMAADAAPASPAAQPTADEAPAQRDAGFATAGPPPHNLPAERSSFVGREREIERTRTALAEHRLVTLTGIGGAGKTRLALRVAALELADFPDGVFFADFAPLVDPELVPRAVAAACGLMLEDSPAGATRTLTDRLVGVLAPRRCLLVVDNCEHLLDASAGLVDRLLAGCAQMAILATSREALGVEGEQALPVPSLALPDEQAPGTVTDAMRLFADRAHAVQPSFQLDRQTSEAVAEICRRLDGIPLAIEFAAARLSHLSAAQVAERLGDRFRLLTGGRRRIARQQTLTTTLDWSHDLLTNSEQTVFRRLAVFIGGFALASAEAVCSGEGIGREQVLDLLGSLVGKSLVGVIDDAEGATRYQLLETVRLYALDKLDAAGETARLRTRHRDHLLQWLEAMPLEALWNYGATIDVALTEIDNLRAACDWCVAQGHTALLARLVTRLGGCWTAGAGGFLPGYREAIRYLRTALADEAALARRERVAAHALLAILSLYARDLQGTLTHATQAIEASGPGEEERADPFDALAWVYGGFGEAVLASMPGASAEHIERARRDGHRGLELMSHGMPRVWLAHGEFLFGMLELHLHPGGALRWLSAAVESLKGERGVDWIRVAALSGLATARHLMGDAQGAHEAALACLAGYEAASRRWLMGEVWAVEVAPALWVGGEEKRAVTQLRRAAAAMRRDGVDLAPNTFLCVAGVVETLRGNPERAGRLFGAARAVGGADENVISFRTASSAAIYLRYRPLVQAALGPERARLVRQEGRAMSVDEAFDYALAGLE